MRAKIYNKDMAPLSSYIEFTRLKSFEQIRDWFMSLDWPYWLEDVEYYEIQDDNSCTLYHRTGKIVKQKKGQLQ